MAVCVADLKRAWVFVFPVCCSLISFVFHVLLLLFVIFQMFFFLCLPDSRDRSPGARGVLGLGDEV